MFVEELYRIGHSLARRYTPRFDGHFGFDYEDLVQEAVLAGLEADGRFDGRGSRGPWAYLRAEGAVKDAIRNNISRGLTPKRRFRTGEREVVLVGYDEPGIKCGHNVTPEQLVSRKEEWDLFRRARIKVPPNRISEHEIVNTVRAALRRAPVAGKEVTRPQRRCLPPRLQLYDDASERATRSIRERSRERVWDAWFATVMLEYQATSRNTLPATWEAQLSERDKAVRAMFRRGW